MKSTLSTNDGAATEELNEEKPKPFEPSLVHDEIFQPTETTRLSGVKVRRSQSSLESRSTIFEIEYGRNIQFHGKTLHVVNLTDGKFGERTGGTVRIHTSAYLEHVPSVPREPESTRNQNARLQKVHNIFRAVLQR